MTDDRIFIGALNMIDTARFERGEISGEQAVAIAAANTRGQQERFEAQMADARAARARIKDWLEA